MELSELNYDETLVLVGFMRVVIHADGTFSGAEREHVAIVSTALGMERFHQAMIDATNQFPDNDHLKRATKAVTRAAARTAIHDVLLKIAASDKVTPEEDKPLRWLESWWELPRT